MFLEKISNFLVKNRKKIFFYSLFAVFIFIALHDVTFANENGTTDNDKTDWVGIFNSLLAAIAAMAGSGMFFVTMLLDPDFSSGSAFGINGKLHDIWILVSNIVYFIFAFILIWIAFMNIIGKGDKWELKQSLPRFIIGVLIVPFSWFIINLFVGLSSILSMAALSLPSELLDSTKDKILSTEMPIHCELDFSKLSLGGDSDEGKSKKGDWFKCEDKGKGKVTISKLGKQSAYGLMSLYVFGLIKVDTLPILEKGQIDKDLLKNAFDLVLYIVFNILFILIFTILLITLALVLFTRLFRLWIYMALSPIFGLAYFFGKDGGGDFLKKFNFSEFLGLVMVPFYTLLAFSFGFLILSITMTGLSENSGTGEINNFKICYINNKGKCNEENDPTNPVGSKIEITNIESKPSLIIKGGPFSNLKSKNSVFKGIFSDIGGFIGAFFMNIFGVVIFRIAIMAALRSSEITKAVTEPIKQFGDSIGELAVKAPTYAPVFGGKSATELGQTATSFKGSIESYYSGKGSKLGTEFADKMGFVATEARKALNEFNAKFNNVSSDNIKSYLIPLLKQLGTKNISQAEFNNIISSLVKKGVLNENKARNIKFDDRLNPKSFSGKLFDALEQDVKNKSKGMLDGRNDLVDLYTLGQITDTSTYEDKMSKVSKDYDPEKKDKDGKTIGGSGKIKIGGTTINVKVDSDNFVKEVVKADKDDFAEQVISLVSDHRKLSSLLGKINMKETKYWEAIQSYVYQKDGDIKFFRREDEAKAKAEGYNKISSFEDYKILLSSKKTSKDSKKT